MWEAYTSSACVVFYRGKHASGVDGDSASFYRFTQDDPEFKPRTWISGFEISMWSFHVVYVSSPSARVPPTVQKQAGLVKKKET